MKKFIYDKHGDLRWTPIWFGLLVYVLIGLVLMKPDLGLAFGPRILRSGLWIVLCPAAAAYGYYRVKKQYDAEQDSRGVNIKLFALTAIMMSGIFGSLTAIKNDQASGITDVLVVYANGHVVNATDPAERNWYFNWFRPNSVDSLYIVTHNEEPGNQPHRLHHRLNAVFKTPSVGLLESPPESESSGAEG